MVKTANKLAEEIMIGNTRIKIYTDFCDEKTAADMNTFFAKISEIALEDARRSRYQGKE